MFLILFSLPLFANTEDDKKPDENEEEEKKIITIADETKSASKIDGLFMLYQDTKKGNLMMVLRDDQIDRKSTRLNSSHT